MTLAVIFLNVSLALYSVVTSAQASLQSAQSANTSSSQGQDATQPQNPPAQSQPSASQPTQKSSTPPKKQKGQKTNYRKRARPPDCNPAPAATSAPDTSDPSTKASTGAKDPPAAAPSTNCPPQKVIVRQGSTAEPSIQLVGGDAPSQHDAADQMLAATDANLKKIEGTQLSSSQKDMVTQIRQFMDQSKKATADGDTEQARTLAWKAKTLSEELVAPPK